MSSTIVRTVAVAVVAATLATTAPAELQRSAVPSSAGSPLRLVEPDAPRVAALQCQAEAPTGGARVGMLQNVSDAPMTAWNFACVVGFRDGRHGWVGGGTDRFSERDADALLQPGETVLVTLPDPPARRSPFEVWTCGPAAAVFADGRTWGSPKVLADLFERRVARVREAGRLLDAIEDLRASGRLHAADAVPALHAALSGDSAGTYDGRLAGIESAPSSHAAAEGLAGLEAELRAELEAMLPHLRPSDLERLEGEAR